MTKPSAGLLRAIAVAAVLAGVGVAVMVLASDHQEAKAAFAIFGPAVGWGFIGSGLWAWRREPANKTGRLLVALGFAWLLSTLESVEQRRSSTRSASSSARSGARSSCTSG